jgi:hypothetical protein
MRYNLTVEFFNSHFNLGKSITEIASEIGCSRQTLHNKLKQLGIEKPCRVNYGQTYGKWTVIGDTINSKCECECKCGTKRMIYVPSLLHGNTTRCKKCCYIDRKGTRPIVGEIKWSWWKNIENAAVARGLEFSVSREYAWKLFVNQDRKCRLSNVEIGFEKPTTASLDRIDSTRGYIEGNIQWLHKSINKMKSNLRQDDFVNFCRLITENNR